MNYESCTLCPRRCFADRTDHKTGSCGSTDTVRIGRAALHFYEEPCISGTRGSGAVFFTGCPLRCVYCQNAEISRKGTGRALTVRELAEVFLKLQESGAHNLNLVTPTHFAPSIIEAAAIAKAQGFSLPIVYNTSGYETVEAVKALRGTVDVYLTDFKYGESALAKAFSGAPDYPEVAMKALGEMVRSIESSTGGEPFAFDEHGLMKKGVIVRHLVLPGHIRNSKAVIRTLYEAYGDRIYMSIMNQFTPVVRNDIYPELNRRLTKREYDRVVDYALSLGVKNAFIQEGKTQSASFIPVFDGSVL